MKSSRKNALNFFLLGVLFGLIFPIIATVITVSDMGMAVTIPNILTVQDQTRLLWIIDTAPLFLGILAAIAGFRQDQLETVYQQIEKRLEEETRLRTELNTLNQKLEQRVEERTLDVERRSSYIEAATEVGHAATSIYRLDELLPKVVDLITEKFGFYQSGIFTLDERNEFAELKAASSEGGKRMLARNHRLKVGEQGLVGYVTSTGQARIALDVGEDAVHFNTPELPGTRSEIALPLYYGGRIFGTLDVQSTEAGAFSEDDISALSVLADQVSMAINNALLFEELQTSLESERKAFGEVSRVAWQDFIRQSGSWGYRYRNSRISPTETNWPEDMSRAISTQEIVHANPEKPTLSVPIKISGKPIGAIRLSKDYGMMNWTDDEVDLVQVLTERLGEALESARLFQATQQQAVQEQLSSEISSQLRQTLDIDTVLKTAAKQLGDAFNAREVVIRMAPNEPK